MDCRPPSGFVERTDWFIVTASWSAVSYVGWQVVRRRVLGLRQDSQAARSLTRTKGRILRMLVVTCVIFALSWLPLYSLRLKLLFADPGSISQAERDGVKRYALPVAQWLGAANSCVNPFIYCYFSAAFRRGFRQTAPPRTCCRLLATRTQGRS